MNTGSMPGFTAEASLYVSRECYHSQMSMPGNGQVIPQLRISCLIKAGIGFLRCMGEGVLGQGTCEMLARLEYGVCDFVGGV